LSRKLPSLALAILAAGLVTGLVAGCSDPAPAPAPKQGDQLVATLVSPTDITLTWKADGVNVAGRVVEFATEPQGQYTILQFVGPTQTTYTHPDLIPETKFYYRIRPVYGPASAAVEVTLPEGAFDDNADHGDQEWVAPHTVAGPTVATQSIRNSPTAGAPTDLKATVMDANGVKLTWTDHASDEEGYLLEVKPASSAGYGVAAVFERDINAAGLVTLPNEKKAAIRVRAFYYGEPSNVAYQKTGSDQK